MSAFKISFPVDVSENMVRVDIGFDVPATNVECVKDAHYNSETVKNQLHGKVVLVNGPASLPVAMTLAHTFGHVCRAIACYDPKLGAYVVAISHDPNLELGQLITV